MFRLLNFAVLVVATVALASSCAMYRRDRCYLAETRYMMMRTVFLETGSYQRAAQAMKEEGWAHCEVNQFRYRLRKDLFLDDPAYDELFREEEPVRRDLTFNPGRVERVPR